jgi:hypothetical protein
MPSQYLNLLTIDPGATSGWCHVIIPRISMFGDAESEITSWSTGEIRGDEDRQALEFASLARRIQGLDYKNGTAVVCEDFDFGSPLKDSSVYSPVRIAAKLKLLHYMHMMDDSSFLLQSRTMAKSYATDERLRLWGFWVPNSEDHERDAVRHALTILKRAKQKRVVRNRLWSPINSATGLSV